MLLPRGGMALAIFTVAVAAVIGGANAVYVLQCESCTRIRVACPEAHTISVIDAFYGRLRGDVCPGARSSTVTDCYRAMPYTNCLGKGFCSVAACNRDHGDPCTGVL